MTQYEQIKYELRREPRTWLITGVAGFIGSNLLEALLDLGQNVIGLDNFSSGYRRNLREVMRERRPDRDAFRLVEGDIREPAVCLEACRGVDFVLHQAAIGSVPRSVQEPALVDQVNVNGTINVIMAARECNVKRTVFASSSAVFGDGTAMPAQEDQLGTPLSPYAVTKLTNEKYAEVLARIQGMEIVALRYFNVFGPRQDPLGSYAAVIPRWIHAMLSDEVCYIHGDGETSRDFVAIGDVVQANLLAALKPLSAEPFQVYNVGAGQRTSLNQLHAMLADGLAGQCPQQLRRTPVHDEFRAGDIRHSQADISRIQRELGYAPVADLSRALEDTVCWYLTRLGSAQLMTQRA
jgi:UDP-N-acetylglucosamine 4-epimerase